MTDSASSKDKGHKSDLIPRLLTALVMVPIMLVLIFARELLVMIGEPIPADQAHWFWFLFICGGTTIGLREINRVLLAAGPHNKGLQPESKRTQHAVTTIGMTFFVALYLFVGQRAPFAPSADPSVVAFACFAFVTWATFLFHTLRPRHIPTAASTMASSLAGILYVGFGFIFTVLVQRDLAHGGVWVCLLLGLCWLSDTGAYFAGRALGGKLFKRKLAPVVSPNKSIEGSFGGMLGSLAAALIFGLGLLPTFTLLDVVLLALPANVLAQTGDLCASLIKRSVEEKDFGAVVYGHGGMLDRVDAVIFVAPYVYIYARLVMGL